ncbi:MAG TPA: nuclear transport factor 2 family protein [Steroidobacteraceae bacterium]|jgi:hypothetical protein|nr:nuclear transport factor 2 family protein [Steroidobacteraceae bacterium]
MKHPLPLILWACGLLCVSPGSVLAAKLPPDLAKAVADYDAAQIKGDGAELKRLLADDYTLVNKKAWTNGAVMGGIATLSGTDGGRHFEMTLRFADIWAKRHGVWQVIYTHVSKESA